MGVHMTNKHFARSSWFYECKTDIWYGLGHYSMHKMVGRYHPS